jgi:ACS family glucarate transporter-like MFS transporter
MSILNVGFAAAVPGLCGGFGGILGGVLSDKLLHRGHSLSFARKVPIMAGMALSMTMIACNYAQAQSIMLLFMSIAFTAPGIVAALRKANFAWD